jgi:hypothetical protein
MVAGMERRYEIEILRRSIAMLSPEANALKREQAIPLLDELAEVSEQLERLRAGLRALIADAPGSAVG